MYFHTDAVQAVGKIPISLRHGGTQFVSVSGHKLHCPKGVGVLYANRKSRFSPFLTGGSQESYKRAGTQNVASIVAMGKACEIAATQMDAEGRTVRALRDRFEQRLLSSITGVQVNGDPDNRLPNTSNLAFENIDAEMLLQLLDDQNVACSAGSACTAGSVNPSHVLKAMGFSDRHARSSLRFSFSRFNTVEEADCAAGLIEKNVAKLRTL